MSATGFQRRRRMIEGVEPGQPDQPTPEEQKAPETPALGAPLSLADMTVRELRELAESKGIPLGRDLTKKADIVAVVEKALGESSAHSSLS